MIYTIKSNKIELSVNSFGASMHSLKYMGEERLWQGGQAWASRDVVIFPVVGHAGSYIAEGRQFTPKSHGVARYSEFNLLSIGENEILLELSSSEETKLTYPYDFILQVKYTVKENSVNISYCVKSKGGRIPFYVGSHAGMQAPGGEAVIEFENVEEPIQYLVDRKEAICLQGIKRFIADKELFKNFKTLQFGDLSGGEIYAHTADGYTYTYKSDCPVVAIWSNENEGDYICVECWWGINDLPDFPKELAKKPFVNFVGEEGKSFTYTLTVSKQ